MNNAPRVMIVDPSPDSREVLRTLLERRGAVTIEARRPEHALQLADLHPPDLILIDTDCDHSVAGSALEALQAAAGQSDTPIVILGTVSTRRGQLPPGHFVPKPYHYGPLIRKISDLLAAA